MATLEEQKIYAENHKFLEAWNQGDAKATAAFFTEDGTRVGAVGEVAHGRQQITSAFEHLMNNVLPGAKAKFDQGTVRMLSPELAVWQGGLEIQKADSSEPIKGHVVQIMKKENDRWLILEAHPKFYTKLD